MSLPVYEKSCQSRWRERNQFADFRRGQKWEFKKKNGSDNPIIATIG